MLFNDISWRGLAVVPATVPFPINPFFVHPTEEMEREEGVSDCWQYF